MNSKKNAIAAVAMAALATSGAGAGADDTAAEIRLLKERLKHLEAKVAKQDREQKESQAKLRQVATAAPAPGIVCKDQPCPPPPPAPPPVWVSFTNGLKVNSYDHDFSFKIGGRVFVDGGISTQPFEGRPVALAPFFPVQAASGYSNQVGIRQARVQAEGTAFKWWDYKMQYDFAGSSNGLIVGGIRDAYLLWRYFEPLTFEVGNFFEPFSLARYSPILYQDFIERPFAGDLLAPSRHIGLAAGVGGGAPGLLGDPNWSLKGGIFSTSVEDGSTSSGIAGAPSAGSSAFLAPVAGGHQYWDAAGRLTYAPILTEESLLHAGGSIRYHKPNDATAFGDDRVLQPGSTLKSEANILNEGLLGTQPLTCVAATLSPSTQVTQVVGGNCTKDVVNYSAELVASYGPLSVQGEYLGMHYNRDAALISLFGAPGGASVNFSGYYVYATWYLTGESRAASYKTYTKDYERPGTFGQIKILNPVSAGGWGAWEVAARLSEINLNDGGFLVLQPIGIRSNIQGGRQTDFTLGLNWYPDKGIRFMANWVNVLQIAAPYNRPDINGMHPQLFVMRAQVNW